MIEKEIDLSALEETEAAESRGKKSTRSGNLGWRIFVLLLALLLIGGLGYGLYSGTFSRLALQSMREESEKLRERIQAQTAENADKDAQIEARLADSAARDAELLRLAEEGPEKDAQLDALRADEAEKDAQLQAIDNDIAQKDAQLRLIDNNIAQKDAQISLTDEEIAQKDAQIEALTVELDAARAPLLYQEALRKTVPPAAIQALELPEGMEQSEETKTALLSQLLEGACLGTDPEETRDDNRAYRIWAGDGQLIGSVAFAPVTEEGSAFPVWTAEENYDFSAFDFSDYFHTASVIVPADYQVYLGSTLLGSEWVREEGLPYETFSACPEVMEDLPDLVRYKTPPFLGEPALRILNEKGQELSLEELSEAVFLDRCPEDVREQIEAFLPEFCRLFLLFSADIRESASYYYAQLRPMVLPGSLLDTRLKDAFEGLGYSAARKAEFDSVTLHSVTDLGDGRYAVDLNYLSYVTGHSSSFDPVEDDLHMLLILVQNEKGELLAEALYYL